MHVQKSRLTTGKAPTKRQLYYYYDEANFTGVRYNQYKLLFSSKRNSKWDGQLAAYGRPILINLLMDPYEQHTDDDYTRKYSEFKNWVYAPLLGLMQKHLASFKEFPPRQTPLTADFTVDIERIEQALGTHD